MHADTRPLRNNAEFLHTNVPILGKAENQCTSQPRLRSGLCIDHQASDNVFNNLHSGVHVVKNVIGLCNGDFQLIFVSNTTNELA